MDDFHGWLPALLKIVIDLFLRPRNSSPNFEQSETSVRLGNFEYRHKSTKLRH
ncbi:hypothetical protein SAMN04488568_10549 [Maricaulis salignorans]|uniref:Uncharacterized protein n=1 Tax=Maricaulis salignorans TaxID=144026 RepID=A0A1G9QJU6_9PROT|nr:hypothetical protein SAMN04488568_10549 [Maricaulis salignorans]